MRQDRLSFPEAMRALATSAGIALPEERGRQERRFGPRRALRVMDLAGRFYADALWKPIGERAREYLGQRGIDTGIARRFGLGWAPEGWETLLTFMKGEHVAEETLIAAGLAIARENRAGAYDRFRGRLLFPIRDLQGRVVAFGGRGFGDEQPKYLNSPETPLYTKGNLLYAADLARTDDPVAEPRAARRGLRRLHHGASIRLHRNGRRARHGVHSGAARPSPSLLRRGRHILRRRRRRPEGRRTSRGAPRAHGTRAWRGP